MMAYGAIMNARTQITIDPEMQRRAQAKAAELGLSFAAYIRRLLAQDLGETKRKADVSVLFDLVDEGPPTNIARDKDKMVGEAVWEEHQRKTRRKRTGRVRLKVSRR
jgi:hypothetical protein